MREFYLMVGLAGSGKSTIAKEIEYAIHMSSPKYDEYGRADKVVLISSDDIREEILGDVNDQTQNDKVFSHIHKLIKQAVRDYNHIIVDATNLTIKNRRALLNCLDDKKDYHKIAYIVNTPIEKCKENNSKRDRKVPEYVIDNQAKKFEIPFANEGFNSIFLHHFPAYNCGALKEEILLNNITSLMDGFNQKNHHHIYDLGTHCRKLHEELSKRTDDKILLCSALVHDIGKLYTGAPKEDGSGEYSYKQHNNFGAYYLITNLEKIESNRLDEILELLFYVNYHMHPFFVQSGKSEKKWKDIFGEEKYNKLFLFNECDKMASGTHRN